MKSALANFAFIDSQNVNLGVKELGWRLDFHRFRVYLEEKYGVRKAYLFIGYLPENQDLYDALLEYGYVLIFKPVIKNKVGNVKDNVDAELVLQAMIDQAEYEKAIIVTSDGDFHCLVKYLYRRNKLGFVLSPNRIKCSVLLKRAARGKIVFFDNLRGRLGRRK